MLMKKILVLLCMFSLLLSQVSAVDEKIEYQACFDSVSSLVSSDWGSVMLVESADIFLAAYQWEKELPIKSHNKAYQYIPFTTNISQIPKTLWVKNRYDFWSIDTNTTTQITLQLWEYESSSNYELNFSHSAKWYIANFYISEDGQEYDYVGTETIWEQSAQDFKTSYIKIVFLPKSKSPTPRELIEIRELSVKRIGNVLAIENIDPNQAVEVYSGLRNCTHKWDIYAVKNTRDTTIPWAPMYFLESYKQQNPLFIDKIRDSDNDGIKNLYDNCRDVKNSNQKDINQNNIWDACEFDSDNDSIPDEIDNCRNTANANQLDDDNDNIWNACDNCQFYNPDQRDSNWDGVGDVCETRENFLIANDDDEDRVQNLIDNCPAVSNPNQADSDNDGVWDVCDNCMTFQNYDQADTNSNWVWDICEDSDGDGIDSLEDNCITIANPDQADSDNDGIWNVCEDDDGDRVLFINDNCPLTRNADQKDTDKDGLWDACDDKDDRLLESNKALFITLMLLVMAWFFWAIVVTAQKLKK